MRRSLRALWPLVLALTGCYPEPTFDGEPCSSSTDCERGKGCRVSDGVCIDIPDNALMGTFVCTVGDDPNTAESTFGGSDVTGFIDEVEFSQIATSTCVLYPDGTFSFNLLGLRFSLTAGLSESDVGRHLFPLFDRILERGVMLGPPIDGGGDILPLSAYVVGGFYELDRRPVVGEKVSVYLEAFLGLAAEEEQVGIPCESGQPACGAYPFSRAFCAELLNPVCTAYCDTASDCEPYGGDTCDDELCYRSCSSDADCSAPLECLTLSNGVSICV